MIKGKLTGARKEKERKIVISFNEYRANLGGAVIKEATAVFDACIRHHIVFFVGVQQYSFSVRIQRELELYLIMLPLQTNEKEERTESLEQNLP